MAVGLGGCHTETLRRAGVKCHTLSESNAAGIWEITGTLASPLLYFSSNVPPSASFPFFSSYLLFFLFLRSTLLLLISCLFLHFFFFFWLLSFPFPFHSANFLPLSLVFLPLCHSFPPLLFLLSPFPCLSLHVFSFSLISF